MAYNPNTGLVYIPAMNDPATYEKRENFEYVKGINNQGVTFSEEIVQLEQGELEREEPGGFLLAWDPIKAAPAWKHKIGDFIFHGGVLTTAGNLVIQARDDGLMMVYAADTGAVLHQIQTGSSILAAPLSYTVDGEQYIAVMAGYGGGPFAYYPVGSAVEKYGNEGRLIAFKLGGDSVPLPKELPALGPIPEPPLLSSASNETLEREKAMYEKACGECHWNTNGGYSDLRRMSVVVHSIFKDIVLDGVYEPLGMAGFADILSEAQVDDIYQYLLNISQEAYLEGQAQAG